MIDVAGVLGVGEGVSRRRARRRPRSAGRSRSAAPRCRRPVVEEAVWALGTVAAGGFQLGDRAAATSAWYRSAAGRICRCGDLDRQLRLDVDRLAGSFPGRSRTASGARARERRRTCRTARSTLGEIRSGRLSIVFLRFGRPRLLGLLVPGLAVVVAVEDDLLALGDELRQQAPGSRC